MYWCKRINKQFPVHGNIALKCPDILSTIGYLPLSNHILLFCYNCEVFFTNLVLNFGLLIKVPHKTSCFYQNVLTVHLLRQSVQKNTIFAYSVIFRVGFV